MSLVFSDTGTKRGLVQMYEKEAGFEYGDVSGDTGKLQTFTADANLAIDDFMLLALTAEGARQVDDENHEKYSIITTDLIQDQRDYAFRYDQQGNAILDIYQLFSRTSATAPYVKLIPVDVSHNSQTFAVRGAASGVLVGGGLSSFTDGKSTRGTPTRYDLIENGVFLDYLPPANVSDGLMAYVSREGSYFTTSDSTKRPGVPGLFHRYFYMKPALENARRNTKGNYEALAAEIAKYEGNPAQGVIGSIQRYFSRRSQDGRPRMTAAQHSNR